MRSSCLFVCLIFLVTSSTYSKERVVTDLTSVWSTGVPTDFSYNETSQRGDYNNSSGQLASAPGCPKSNDGYPWIYYYDLSSPEETFQTRCFLAGSQATCSEGQVLFVQDFLNVGICGGEWLTSVQSDAPTYNSKAYQLCLNNRGQQSVYNSDDDDSSKCYNAFETGTCEDGNILGIRIPPGVKNSKRRVYITCMPQCTLSTDWKSMELNGDCAAERHSSVKNQNFANSLGPLKCPQGEVFSAALLKCAKRPPKNSQVG